MFKIIMYLWLIIGVFVNFICIYRVSYFIINFNLLYIGLYFLLILLNIITLLQIVEIIKK